MSTDRIIESARQIAELWKQRAGERDQADVRFEDAPLADLLDELVRRCSAPVHHPFAFKQIVRGRAENGYQPETEHFWTCACRDGKSGDMGGSQWAKQAADTHRADPTQFPGWPE